MKVISYKEPFPHIIIDEFFDKQSYDNVFEEILSLKETMGGPHITGAARSPETNQYIKRGHGIVLDLFYKEKRNDSRILTSLEKLLFCDEVLEIGCKTGFFFTYYYPYLNRDYTVLQSYGDGDYYDAHMDQSIVTSITLVYKEPKEYDGGVLSFPEEKYEIYLKNNQTIIFPSRVPHQVSKVIKSNDNFETNRFTISKLISFNSVE